MEALPIGDRDPVGLGDRMGEGDRIARPRAGDRDRPVVGADRAGNGNITGGERFGLGEGELDAVDAQPGHVGGAAGRQQPQSIAGGLERGGLGPPADGDRCDITLDLVGADVHRAVDDPDKSGAALIGGQGLSGRGIDGQGVASGVDGGAAGQEGDGLGRPAVISQRAEPGVGDADLVAVDAVGQAAGTAGADQVVYAIRGHQTIDITEVEIGCDQRVVQDGRLEIYAAWNTH